MPSRFPTPKPSLKGSTSPLTKSETKPSLSPSVKPSNRLTRSPTLQTEMLSGSSMTFIDSKYTYTLNFFTTVTQFSSDIGTLTIGRFTGYNIFTSEYIITGGDTGVNCPTFNPNRGGSVKITCGPQQINSIVEGPVCFYKITIITPTICRYPSVVPTTSSPSFKRTSIPSVLPTVSPSPVPISYVGCYRDKAATRAFPVKSSSVSTVSECALIAKTNGYSFFGLGNYKKNGNSQTSDCWLGSSQTVATQNGVDNSVCTLGIEGNSYGKNGILKDGVAVYKITN
jgi:hypothetical protein